MQTRHNNHDHGTNYVCFWCRRASRVHLACGSCGVPMRPLPSPMRVPAHGDTAAWEAIRRYFWDSDNRHEFESFLRNGREVYQWAKQNRGRDV